MTTGRRMHGWRRLSALLLVLALVAASCGGDDDADADDTAADRKSVV